MNYAFISYSSKDQRIADATRNLFHRKKIATWMAPYDIPADSVYAGVINDAFKNCSCVVLLLAENAQQSPWVSKEVERAINYRKPVVTLQLEDIKLKSTFQFSLCDQQIVAVPSVEENSPEMKKILHVVAGLTASDDAMASDTADVTAVGSDIVESNKSVAVKSSEGLDIIQPGEAMKFFSGFFAENGISITGIRCTLRSPSVVEYTVDAEDEFSPIFCKHTRDMKYVDIKAADGSKRTVINVCPLSKKLVQLLNNANVICHYVDSEKKFVVHIPLKKADKPLYSQWVVKSPDESGQIWIPLGLSLADEVDFTCLSRTPHIFVGGDKEEDVDDFVRGALTHIVSNYNPDRVQLLISGGREISPFKLTPHATGLAIYKGTLVEQVLELKEEMDRRYCLFMEKCKAGGKCSSIDDYNKFVDLPLPYIVFVINGYVPDKTMDEQLIALMTKSRAAGIYTIVSIKGKSISELTGRFAHSFSLRVAFKCQDKQKSRTLIETDDAASLSEGMLMCYSSWQDVVQLQGFYVDDKYISEVMARLNDPEVIRRLESKKAPEQVNEVRFPFSEKEFAEIVLKICNFEEISLSALMRHLSMGFNKAHLVYDKLCKMGYVDAETKKVNVPQEDIEKYKEMLSLNGEKNQ